MRFPTYKVGPIEYWLAEAATQFINGAISGVKLGGLIGGGTGVTGNMASLTADLPAFKQVLIAVSGFLVTMAASGVAAVSDWHRNGNPFPNVMPKPPQP
jgi:hypothetical protein